MMLVLQNRYSQWAAATAVLLALLSVPGDLYAQTDLCDEHISLVLIDRTSVMHASETRSLDSGLARLLDLDKVLGQLEVIEISDQSVSYKPLLSQCMLVERKSETLCQVQEQPSDVGVWQRFVKIIAGSSRDGNAKSRLTDGDCLTLKKLESKQLADLQSEITEKFKFISDSPPPPSHRTDLVGTVLQLLSSHCSARSCSIYIFSNLLDRRFKDLHAHNGESDDNYFEFGKKLVETLSGSEQNTPQIQEIVVWGFGFVDLDSKEKDELPDKMRRDLQEFWNGVFSDIVEQQVAPVFDFMM